MEKQNIKFSNYTINVICSKRMLHSMCCARCIFAFVKDIHLWTVSLEICCSLVDVSHSLHVAPNRLGGGVILLSTDFEHRDDYFFNKKIIYCQQGCVSQ